LFDNLGIHAFIGGIQQFSNIIGGLIEKLSMADIGDMVSGILNRATQAIQTFSNLLVNITIEFSLLINRVEQAIESIGVADMVDQIKGVLNRFNQEVAEGLNRVFGPVRTFLQESFDNLNNLLAAFDPGIILDEVKKILQKLTDILGNEDLMKTITGIRSTLDGVNGTLLTFRFNPVTDPVVSGIGTVKGVFDIAGRIPMPDSVASEVGNALKELPSADHIRKIKDELLTGLEEFIEDGPKPVLIAIKDKPSQLITLVEQYAPNKLLGDKLSEPYQKFVGEVEKLKPTLLFQPVKIELDKLMDKVKEQLDPSQLFVQLEDPFNSLIAAVDALDPNPFIMPLQEKLTSGIQAITSRLPFDAADEIFEVVNGVADKIRQGVESMQQVSDGISKINMRLGGLAQSEQQVREWGNEVSEKLSSITDFEPVTAMLRAVDTAIADIESLPLSNALFTPMDALMSEVNNINPQNALIALVQAKRGFPEQGLQNLPDTPEKQSLLGLLQDFNPMGNLYTRSFGGLQDMAENWIDRRVQLVTFFNHWQQNFFGANGGLACYRRPGMTLLELRDMMAETIMRELTHSIAPVFRLIDHIKALLAAILTEIETLIGRLEAQMQGLLAINDALNALRDAVQSIVGQLNELDISFIVREIEEVFNAVKAQLEAINPVEIGKALKETFDNLIDSIDPVAVLGITELDAQHQTLVNLLKERDPKVLLTDKLQPEYDKIVDFLKLFDIKIIVEKFLMRIEGLQIHLDEELERVIVAYDDMIGAIPGPLSGSIGMHFSVSTN
jgi:ABC-type transporter Mla subunit MlaD